jgi:hypothetical protein
MTDSVPFHGMVARESLASPRNADRGVTFALLITLKNHNVLARIPSMKKCFLCYPSEFFLRDIPFETGRISLAKSQLSHCRALNLSVNTFV